MPAYLDVVDYELYTAASLDARSLDDVLASQLAHGCGALAGGSEALAQVAAMEAEQDKLGLMEQLTLDLLISHTYLPYLILF